MYTNQTQLPSNNLQNDFKGPKTPILLIFFFGVRIPPSELIGPSP